MLIPKSHYCRASVRHARTKLNGPSPPTRTADNSDPFTVGIYRKLLPPPFLRSYRSSTKPPIPLKQESSTLYQPHQFHQIQISVFQSRDTWNNNVSFSHPANGDNTSLKGGASNTSLTTHLHLKKSVLLLT